jgi:hypothetical protein
MNNFDYVIFFWSQKSSSNFHVFTQLKILYPITHILSSDKVYNFIKKIVGYFY